MVTQPRVHMTIEAFEEWATLPANRDRRLQYIGGEIIEVVSNDISSLVGMNVGGELSVYVRAHKLGFVSGADGGYRVADEDYIPDCAFISKEKYPKPTGKSYIPAAPDLAVEVLSHSNDESSMRVKIGNYLKAGTLLWVVDPTKKRVEVYSRGEKVQIVELTGTLNGGDVLSGFSLKVADVFYGVE
ncbi:MAG: Uma2 family endonuclease [Anaerolineae bacterium]|nr:Uma2 family endonuclease [Anaerolineae bacterium]